MIKKTILFIIILTAISQVTALEITFDSSNEININEEFTISINADSSETHDVKIFVHNSEDEEIKAEEYISEIYKDDWKNPWYYLSESYPEQTQYQIRVIESPGEREICVRLRKSDSKTFNTECKPLIVLEKEAKDEEPETPNEEKEETIEEHTEEIEQEQVNHLSTPNQDNEKILLTPQPKPELQITKSGKTRLYILYAFTFFCVAMIILLALRKL